jgi:excisionase family DNA binding protein
MSDELAEYLTLPEVATKLRFSTRTIERLIRSEPTLPALKMDGAWRFHRARLDRWLLNREQQRSKKQMRSAANPAPAEEGEPS